MTGHSKQFRQFYTIQLEPYSFRNVGRNLAIGGRRDVGSNHFSSLNVLPANHAIPKLVRQMEMCDAANPTF